MKLKVSLYDRRQFLRWVSGLGLGAVAAGLALPIWRFLRPYAGKPPTQVDLGSLADLASGASRYFRYGQTPSLVIRRSDGTLVAFSARCTHADCTVSFDTGRQQFLCACHQGVYDRDGRNMPGTPPPRPLQRYHVVEAQGRVVVSIEPPKEKA